MRELKEPTIGVASRHCRVLFFFFVIFLGCNRTFLLNAIQQRNSKRDSRTFVLNRFVDYAREVELFGNLVHDLEHEAFVVHNVAPAVSYKD
jgi:hypothetical protein